MRKPLTEASSPIHRPTVAGGNKIVSSPARIKPNVSAGAAVPNNSKVVIPPSITPEIPCTSSTKLVTSVSKKTIVKNEGSFHQGFLEFWRINPILPATGTA